MEAIAKQSDLLTESIEKREKQTGEGGEPVVMTLGARIASNSFATGRSRSLPLGAAPTANITIATGSARSDLTIMAAKVFKEFWSLVLLARAGAIVYVVGRGWFGAPLNIPGLVSGIAAAAIGLIGVARSGDNGA